MMRRAPEITCWRRRLLAASAAPYRAAGRFARHFAHGKLRLDPVFAAMFQGGLLPARGRVLDLGCGQGLLRACLDAATHLHAEGHWPVRIPPPPRPWSYRGIELMHRDVERARVALGEHCGVERGDILDAELGDADVVVILDVLHYFDQPAQDRVLRRVRDCLRPGGALLLRIGDAGAGLPFRIGDGVDRLVTRVRGHRAAPTHCRALPAWMVVLAGLGFDVEALPMSRGTPFANVLLAARLPSLNSSDVEAVA